MIGHFHLDNRQGDYARPWSDKVVGKDWTRGPVALSDMSLGRLHYNYYAEWAGGNINVYSEAAPVVTPWTMSSLPSTPVMWLNDASSVTGATNASQWSDVSGLNNHVLQPTGGIQPLIVASGLNSKRTIRFNGSNQLMRFAVPTFANLTSAWVAIVCRQSVVTNNRTILFVPVNSSGGNTRFGMDFDPVGTVRGLARRADGDASAGVVSTSASAMNNTNWHVLLFRMDWANGDGFLSLDGNTPTSNTSMTTNGTTTNTAPFFQGVLGAGTAGATPGAFSAVEIAEMAIGYGLPVAADQDRIFGSLHHKWNLQSLLPGAHPYKAAAPIIGSVGGAVFTEAVAVAPRDISMAFNKSGQLVLAWTTDTGVTIRHAGGLINIAGATSVACRADMIDAGFLPESDVYVMYTRAGNLCYRREADSYATEYVQGASGSKLIFNAGYYSTDRRLIVELVAP